MEAKIEKDHFVIDELNSILIHDLNNYHQMMKLLSRSIQKARSESPIKVEAKLKMMNEILDESTTYLNLFLIGRDHQSSNDNLLNIFKKAIQIYESAFDEEKIVIRKNFSSKIEIDVPTICFSRVFINLLKNAVEHQGEGPKMIQVDVFKEKGYYVFDISNPISRNAKKTQVRKSFGLNSVKSLCKKYSCTLETECSEKYFLARFKVPEP